MKKIERVGTLKTAFSIKWRPRQDLRGNLYFRFDDIVLSFWSAPAIVVNEVSIPVLYVV